MGLFGHMRIHDSEIHRNADNTDTPCIPSATTILTATAIPTTTNDVPPASPNFSCPHCVRNFNSRIGLIGHLRIHRTEADAAHKNGTQAPPIASWELQATRYSKVAGAALPARRGQMGEVPPRCSCVIQTKAIVSPGSSLHRALVPSSAVGLRQQLFPVSFSEV
ncbi:unnamed protein product [Schistocephalus solidus]|uniref:C2H2-type domain-containing protein n=1 Tax=Schistocephalus solidus TaxID=70667 RepID=A0A183T649_SCHSO|nr:unnamed protein product [Schistocephalus solidus]